MREAIITLVIHYNAFYTTQVKQFIKKDQMGLLRKADEVDKMTILWGKQKGKMQTWNLNIMNGRLCSNLKSCL